MCTLLFAFEARADAPLIVAANRDEFRGRPTAPLHAWEDAPVIAGRDLRGGGTWMGLGRRGRWAALTNTREPGRERPGARTRGELVTEVLTSARDLEAALRAIAARADDYNGFNLVAWDGRALWSLSTFAGEPRLGLRTMIGALDRYLVDKGVGKAMHDVVAAACAADERVCEAVEVEIYRRSGEWGARAAAGTNTWISVGFDEGRFLDVLAR